jgi:lysophospholipase L1-like esterase
VFVLSIIGFACVLVEFGLRKQYGAWPFEEKQFELPEWCCEKDMTLRWRFSPKGGRNSLGFGDCEIKPKTKFRILLLGDSVAWYIGKQIDELEKQLDIEIINASQGGYTTYQEYELLKIYGLNMKPDLVIIGFCLNDVYYPYLHKDLISIPNVVPENVLKRVSWSDSYLINVVALRLGRYSWQRNIGLYYAWNEEPWEQTENLLKQIKDLVPLAVVIFPLRDQLKNDYLKKDRQYVLYPQKKLTDICKRNEIPCLDLFERLYENGGTSLYTDSIHLSEKGGLVAAEKISEWLKPSCP